MRTEISSIRVYECLYITPTNNNPIQQVFTQEQKKKI